MATPEFKAIVRGWIDGIAAGPLGEQILYRADPTSVFKSLNATVTRRPVDQVGEVLSRSIDILVSKTDVPDISIGKDNVKLLSDSKPGSAAPRYTVEELLQESPGSWSLRCGL